MLLLILYWRKLKTKIYQCNAKWTKYSLIPISCTAIVHFMLIIVNFLGSFQYWIWLKWNYINLRLSTDANFLSLSSMSLLWDIRNCLINLHQKLQILVLSMFRFCMCWLYEVYRFVSPHFYFYYKSAQLWWVSKDEKCRNDVEFPNVVVYEFLESKVI